MGVAWQAYCRLWLAAPLKRVARVRKSLAIAAYCRLWLAAPLKPHRGAERFARRQVLTADSGWQPH